MFRVSNGVITLVNVLTLVVSLCAVSASLWMYVKAESPCDRAVRIPLLAVGGALMAVSMVGLLGSCCRVTFFMWLYLITLFLLIVGLTGFTLFAILVTSEGIEQAIKTVGNDEYSAWLQNHAINAHNWDNIKSCMTAANICHVIQGDDMPLTFKPHFTPIQLGCCQPPAGCSMKTENSTISKREIAKHGTGETCASSATLAEMLFSTTSRKNGGCWQSSTHAFSFPLSLFTLLVVVLFAITTSILTKSEEATMPESIHPC